jgi:hypothetical protein
MCSVVRSVLTRPAPFLLSTTLYSIVTPRLFLLRAPLGSRLAGGSCELLGVAASCRG